MKRTTPMYIRIKFLEILKAEDLKSSQRQKPTLYRGNRGEVTVDFLSEVVQFRRLWKGILKIQKEKKLQPTIP